MVSGEGVGKEDWLAVEPWFALWLFTVTGKRKIHKLLQNGAFRIVFFFDRAQRCFQRFKGYRSLVLSVEQGKSLCGGFDSHRSKHF